MNLPVSTDLVAQTLAGASVGILVPLAVAIVLTAYTIYAGRERIIALILALYPAAIVFQVFPYWDRLPAQSLRFWIFLLLALLLAFVLQKIVASSFFGGRLKRFVEAGVLSVLATGQFFALVYYLHPDSIPIAVTIPFVDLPIGLFVWLTLPLVAMTFSLWKNSA
jgi:hypothetical protein